MDLVHPNLARSLEPSPGAPLDPQPMWRAVLFRFGFVYWLLMAVVVACSEDTGLVWFGRLLRPVWNPIVVWVGAHVLGIHDLNTAITGSTDKTSDWIGVLLAAATAALAALVWSVVDRRAASHPRLRSVLRAILRYTLAFALLGYGSSKLFTLQFSPPGPGRLLQHYGESSPMGLLWTFMGASPTYEVFAGAAETLGALLLLFRRTTALGAFTLAIVLVNVVLLNFCYDVPVKINAVHYLGMCVCLMLPELRRLVDVLVWNRATQPVVRDPVPVTRRTRVAGRILKYGVIGFIVFHDVRSDLKWLALRDTTTWYGGYWNVTRFSRDGQDVPALVTDATRWSRIRFQDTFDKVYARWRFMDDSYGALYAGVIDEHHQLMSFTVSSLDDSHLPADPVTLRYVHPDPDHLVLEGKVGAATLSVQLERLDPGKMLLVSRGFHWITEVPFNR